MNIGLICAYNEAGNIGDAVGSLFAIGCDRVVVYDGAWRLGDGNLFGLTPWSDDGTAEEATRAGAEVVPGINGTDGQKRNAAIHACGAAPGDHLFLLDADERAEGSLLAAPSSHGCVMLLNEKPNDLPGIRGVFPHGDAGPGHPALRWLAWSPQLSCDGPGRYWKAGKRIRAYKSGPLEDMEAAETSALPILPHVRIRHVIEATTERVDAKRRYYESLVVA